MTALSGQQSPEVEQSATVPTRRSSNGRPCCANSIVSTRHTKSNPGVITDSAGSPSRPRSRITVTNYHGRSGVRVHPLFNCPKLCNDPGVGNPHEALDLLAIFDCWFVEHPK